MKFTKSALLAFVLALLGLVLPAMAEIEGTFDLSRSSELVFSLFGTTPSTHPVLTGDLVLDWAGDDKTGWSAELIATTGNGDPGDLTDFWDGFVTYTWTSKSEVWSGSASLEGFYAPDQYGEQSLTFIVPQVKGKWKPRKWFFMEGGTQYVGTHSTSYEKGGERVIQWTSASVIYEGERFSGSAAYGVVLGNTGRSTDRFKIKVGFVLRGNWKEIDGQSVFVPKISAHASLQGADSWDTEVPGSVPMGRAVTVGLRYHFP